jgi:hypothetical protein
MGERKRDDDTEYDETGVSGAGRDGVGGGNVVADGAGAGRE